MIVVTGGYHPYSICWTTERQLLSFTESNR